MALETVILYKHGVGYFEREFRVEGEGTVALRFKASEMNDVLKSLTVVDLDGGVVTSISYESTASAAKQLEDVALQIDDDHAYTGLLSQVKGASVVAEVGSQRVSGIICGVEWKQQAVGEAVVRSPALTLLTEGGVLRAYDLERMSGITLTDESLRRDLEVLLDVLLASKKKDLKELTIFARGEGSRRLRVSYLVEAPVWKTSYRVLLSDAGDAQIQGWALVDNTQGEDWDDVSLSLVSGLPVSFVHDLYSPRYKRRPVVEVVEEEAYAPPMLEDAVAYGEAMEFECAPAAKAMMPSGMPRMRSAAPAAMGGGGRSSVEVQTRTAEIGDLFEYVIANPVTVRRNQSALVPILSGTFDGRRVAVYNEDVRATNPMSAVLFKNTTGLTLEGGPMTVHEQQRYVGESMLETLKPKEERILPFSVELSCKVSVDHRSRTEDVHATRITGGRLHLVRYTISERIYVIDHRGAKDLDLFLEHRFQRGADLFDTQAPVARTESFLRFRFPVKAGSTERFVVKEKGLHSEALAIENVNAEIIAVWFQSRWIDQATRDKLASLSDLSTQMAVQAARAKDIERELQELVADQQRVRENLGALGRSPDEQALRDRYVQELTSGEDRLTALKASLKEARVKGQRLEAQLRKDVLAIEFEGNV